MYVGGQLHVDRIKGGAEDNVQCKYYWRCLTLTFHNSIE